MNRKRLIGVVTVKDGWAVQSFGYRRHLPLGRPEILVENLDRWGADEILVQCIDRSARCLGPDFALLERISRLDLATPLIYAGGIRHMDDARRVINSASDRMRCCTITWAWSTNWLIASAHRRSSPICRWAWTMAARFAGMTIVMAVGSRCQGRCCSCCAMARCLRRW